jgi:hypothetical protein
VKRPSLYRVKHGVEDPSAGLLPWVSIRQTSTMTAFPAILSLLLILNLAPSYAQAGINIWDCVNSVRTTATKYDSASTDGSVFAPSFTYDQTGWSERMDGSTGTKLTRVTSISLSGHQLPVHGSSQRRWIDHDQLQEVRATAKHNI